MPSTNLATHGPLTAPAGPVSGAFTRNPTPSTESIPVHRTELGSAESRSSDESSATNKNSKSAVTSALSTAGNAVPGSAFNLASLFSRRVDHRSAERVALSLPLNSPSAVCPSVHLPIIPGSNEERPFLHRPVTRDFALLFRSLLKLKKWLGPRLLAWSLPSFGPAFTLSGCAASVGVAICLLTSLAGEMVCRELA